MFNTVKTHCIAVLLENILICSLFVGISPEILIFREAFGSESVISQTTRTASRNNCCNELTNDGVRQSGDWGRERSRTIQDIKG